jgi:hypothetical protein
VTYLKINTIKLSLIGVILPLLFAGCRGIGPGTITLDRFGYTEAISESWKRQTLLNTVKIRYADAPVFLDISSVITQYLLETEFQGRLAWNDLLPGNSQSITGRGRYADQPTITYQPLIGEKFTRSLMTPLPPASVMMLIESGWRADMVLQLCVDTVNGFHNRAGRKLPSQQADPGFYKFTNSLRKIQDSHQVGMRVKAAKDKNQGTLTLIREKGIEPEIQTEIQYLTELLGIDPNAKQYNITYGSVAKDEKELAILTRSMLEILSEVSSYIQVPPEHVTEQRTIPTMTDEMAASFNISPLVRINSSLKKPQDAFVTIPYRDHWFWIEDTDYQSKRIFSFLMFLFTLAETGEKPAAPVITIPVG